MCISVQMIDIAVRPAKYQSSSQHLLSCILWTQASTGPVHANIQLGPAANAVKPAQTAPGADRKTPPNPTANHTYE